jgi:hypothetical protein
VAWWLSSQTQLRILIRACCVPPPVTDREEKVVSAKANRKPRASLAVEDLLMLKRVVVVLRRVPREQRLVSQLIKKTSETAEAGISHIPEWKISENESVSLMK